MAVFNRNAPYSETSDPNALIVTLTPKRLELLSELVPEAKVFA